jgi:hypothetical protein
MAADFVKVAEQVQQVLTADDHVRQLYYYLGIEDDGFYGGYHYTPFVDALREFAKHLVKVFSQGEIEAHDIRVRWTGKKPQKYLCVVLRMVSKEGQHEHAFNIPGYMPLGRLLLDYDWMVQGAELSSGQLQGLLEAFGFVKAS